MKEKELREHAICTVCKRAIGHAGLPLFYVLTIERYGVKMDAVKRQDGLSALLGGHARLAAVMGPDEEMTESLMDPGKITVCEVCAGVPHLVHYLAELVGGTK